MSPHTGPPPTAGALKVSVVVPVFNPGPYLERSVRSILGQTLPPADVEAILVDDGSTDGSGARLDTLAAEDPRLRVVHLDPSGAPGRPRNHGLALARGEYVQFLDADDELAPDALERLYAIARRNGSDIVLAKFASASIVRRQELFGRTRERTNLADTPLLIDSYLGPTRLLRTAFVREHGLTFPEGWRQMEDQLFTLRAYLRAEVISVLGGAPCYYFNRRDGDASLSTESIDPAQHARHLRELLDAVLAETEADELRDRIVLRIYRTEMLARLGEADYPDHSPAFRAGLFEAVHTIAEERVDPRIDGGLSTINRLRARLVREARPDAVLALAERIRSIELRCVVDRWAWHHGHLVVHAAIGLRWRDTGNPLFVLERDGRYHLDPALTAGIVAEPVPITDQRSLMRARVVLQAEESALEWRVHARSEVVLHRIDGGEAGTLHRPALRLTATIDPARVGPAHAPLAPGRWRVLVRPEAFGLALAAPMSGAIGTADLSPAVVGDDPHLVIPRLGSEAVELVVEPTLSALPSSLAGEAILAVRDGSRVALRLPVASARGSRLAGRLVVTTPTGTRTIPAHVAREAGSLAVHANVAGSLQDVPSGSYPVSLRLEVPGEPELVVGHAAVDGGGLRFHGLPRLSAGQRAVDARRRLAGRIRAVAADARRAVRERARHAYDGMPAAWQAPIRRAYRRLRSPAVRSG